MMATRGRGGLWVLLADQPARVGQPHTFSSYGIQFQVTGYKASAKDFLMSDGYELKINPAGRAELLRGGQRIRSVPAGPGEKPETIFRRLLRDKTLAGLARVAVMRIVGDTELLKNKSGFVIV